MMDFSRHRFCKVFFKLVVVTKLIVIGGIIVKYDKRWYHLTGFGEPSTLLRERESQVYHYLELVPTRQHQIHLSPLVISPSDELSGTHLTVLSLKSYL